MLNVVFSLCQCTMRVFRTSWRRCVTHGRHWTLWERSTGRSCDGLPRRLRDRDKSSSPRNWRSWGRRNRQVAFLFTGESRDEAGNWLRLVAAGVSGDAKAAGDSAPAGAGEGETDAPGAAETHHSDESTDACLLSALLTGAHCYVHIFWHSQPAVVCRGINDNNIS